MTATESRETRELNEEYASRNPPLPSRELWIPVQRPRELFLRDLRAARPGGVVRVWSGELNPMAYDSDAVEDTVRRLSMELGVDIRFLAGPLIATDDQGWNRVLQLAEENVVKVRFRETRTSIQHFRVVEAHRDLRYYVELPHRALSSAGSRRRMDGRVLPANALAAEAKRATALFDDYWDVLQECSEPVCATLPAIKRLARAASDVGLDLDDLGRIELLHLADADEQLDLASEDQPLRMAV
jgi:hypothetical protein